MTGPSSAPRGERAGRPGTTWETRLVWTGDEHVVPDDDTEPPRPNRATRRAAARKRRKGRR